MSVADDIPALLPLIDRDSPPDPRPYPDDVTDEIAQRQREDPRIKQYLDYLHHDHLPDDIGQQRKLARLCECMLIDQDNQRLYYLSTATSRASHKDRTHRRLVVPANMTPDILFACHQHPSAGHLGFEKTYRRVAQLYFWEGLARDVKAWTTTCIECQMRQTPRQLPAGLLQPIAPTAPWHTVATDIVGPLPITSRNSRYLLTFTDLFTHFCEAFPIAKADAETTAKIFVTEIVCRYGAPQRLLSDRGSNFLADVTRNAALLMGTHPIHTTSYHPATNGACERLNGIYIDMLSKYVARDQRDWDLAIPFISFAYRTSHNVSIACTPHLLMFGREAVTPFSASISEFPLDRYRDIPHYRADLITTLENAWSTAKEAMIAAKEKQKTHFDRHHRHVSYEIGDAVWLFVPACRRGISPKLALRWQGPFTIIGRPSDVNYELRALNVSRVHQRVHVSRLKPYRGSLEPPPSDDPDIPSSDTFDPNTEPAGTLNMTLDSNTTSDSAPPAQQRSDRHRHARRSSSRRPLYATDSDVFEIDSILDMKLVNGQRHYLVRWSDYGPEHDQWIPEEHITPDVIDAYHASATPPS